MDEASAHDGREGKAGETGFSALEPAECSSSTGCCSAPKEQKMEGGNTDCCDDGASPGSVPNYADPDCNEGCCSESSSAKIEDTNNPSCCEGKASPCCDEACLDRIALRECDVSSGMPLPGPRKETP